MRGFLSLLRRFSILSVAFVACIVAYVWLTLSAPVNEVSMRRYHLSGTQLHELSLAIVVPYIVIWLIGLIGYMWLKSYTAALGTSKDGAAFRTISRGILILVLWLPISAVYSSVMARIYHGHPGTTAWLIRGNNYLNILLLLAGFYIVYRGSRALLAVARVRAHGLTQRQSMCYVAFAALYVFVALSDSARQVVHGNVTTATYYLPDWLTVLTILIPRLLVWFIGLAAVANIVLYRQKVKGAIYREALRSLAIGLGVVVIGVTVLRIVQSLTTVLNSWSLGLLLGLIYLLLCILAVGYFMLAKGARRLLKIEES